MEEKTLVQQLSNGIAEETEATSSTNYLQQVSEQSEENDLEGLFANSLAKVLRNIKGKKRRKKAMLEIFKKAITYDRGSDSE